MNYQRLQITDFTAPELDVYARLTEAQLLNKDHPEDGLFIAESPKVVERALYAGYEPVSILIEEADMEKEAADVLAQIADRYADIPVYVADKEVLKNLTGFPMTRGMLCAMRRKELPSVEEVCKNAKRIVVLENVMNPTNVGAIFRSAAALNMDAVLLSSGCSNPLYRRAIRVSMGNIFLIPWTFYDKGEWPENGMNQLKEMGFKLASMALKEKSVGIDDENLMKEEKIAVIMGTEGDGLSDETIEKSDYTVMIPMANGVDSLNVAAASAVAFWQLGNK